MIYIFALLLALPSFAVETGKPSTPPSTQPHSVYSTDDLFDLIEQGLFEEAMQRFEEIVEEAHQVQEWPLLVVTLVQNLNIIPPPEAMTIPDALFNALVLEEVSPAIDEEFTEFIFSIYHRFGIAPRGSFDGYTLLERAMEYTTGFALRLWREGFRGTPEDAPYILWAALNTGNIIIAQEAIAENPVLLLEDIDLGNGAQTSLQLLVHLAVDVLPNLSSLQQTAFQIIMGLANHQDFDVFGENAQGQSLHQQVLALTQNVTQSGMARYLHNTFVVMEQTLSTSSTSGSSDDQQPMDVDMDIDNDELLSSPIHLAPWAANAPNQPNNNQVAPSPSPNVARNLFGFPPSGFFQ